MYNIVSQLVKGGCDMVNGKGRGGGQFHLKFALLDLLMAPQLKRSNFFQRASVSPMSDALAACRTQSVQFFVSLMSGIFEMNSCPIPSLSYSPLTKPLLNQTLDNGFLVDLVSSKIKFIPFNKLY